MDHRISRWAVVEEALNWVGTPYRHQSSLRDVGTDCLGLVRGVYREIIGPEPVEVPAYFPQAEYGEGELLWSASMLNLVPAGRHVEAGNILLFRMRPGQPARHLAISISDGEMVHAAHGRRVARINFHSWWRRHCVARFDFPGVENE